MGIRKSKKTGIIYRAMLALLSAVMLLAACSSGTSGGSPAGGTTTGGNEKPSGGSEKPEEKPSKDEYTERKEFFQGTLAGDYENGAVVSNEKIFDREIEDMRLNEHGSFIWTVNEATAESHEIKDKVNRLIAAIPDAENLCKRLKASAGDDFKKAGMVLVETSTNWESNYVLYFYEVSGKSVTFYYYGGMDRDDGTMRTSKLIIKKVSQSSGGSTGGGSGGSDALKDLDGTYTIQGAKDGASFKMSGGKWTFTYASKDKTGTYSANGDKLTIAMEGGGSEAVFSAKKTSSGYDLTAESGAYTIIIANVFQIMDEDVLTGNKPVVLKRT